MKTILLLMFFLVLNEGKTVKVKVGVILDSDRAIGKMSLRCIEMALYDFYASHPHYKTRLILHVRNSDSSVVGAATAYHSLDLIKNVKVEAIIGPGTSMQASFVINLGNESRVPVISFSATNPSLSSLRSEYFLRATLNDSSQVQAIISLVKSVGWRNVVPIYVDNDFGEGIIPYLNDALHQIGTRIPYRSVINPSAVDHEIKAELYKLMTMPTRVFVLHMEDDLGSRVLRLARDIGMMSEEYVWIVTNALTNALSLTENNSLIKGFLQGVIGIKTYVPKSKILDDFTGRWKMNSSFEEYIDVNVYGLWAYDATTSLAIAVEKGGHRNLLQALLSTRFRGLGGDFHIVDRELQSPGFDIIHGISNEERVIGFWTMKNGIVKKLDSVESVDLREVVWPGESRNTPKGWVYPTNGRRLRIGVPVKLGLIDPFVKLVKDRTTNTSIPVGFCIDVFEDVIASLPYALPFDYIPFSKPSISYDELVYEVFTGNFDAVVGDVTIRANRSLYVDFTLPYTESGINMIVPVKDKRQKNAWVFLKPLTWDLWVTSLCFFIFIGFVIWILEHEINDDFNGTLQRQLGTSFWFSFSIMVFAHREKVVNNLSRFVVIIWCFVVLILIQSYTASLTSTLTVKQLEPTFRSIEEIVEKGETIGYPRGSFVEQLLRSNNMANLKEYKSRDELHMKFSNNEIAAAFDEMPYLKPFLKKYCSEYTVVGPTLYTNGFAFVFPNGSPLVADISSAILRVIEGDEITKIEEKWFGKQTVCPDTSSSISSSSLGVNSFWGLFVIVGVASSFAVIVFLSILAFENRSSLMRVHPREWWNNITNDTLISEETDETNQNISNNDEQEEETLLDRENPSGQTGENIVVEPHVSINQDD